MDIIQQLAEGKVVERTLMNIAHRSRLSYDLQDLSQMIYVVLLEYDSDTIVGLWQRNEIGNWIVGIIRKQLFSRNSPYYYEIVKQCEGINERTTEE